MSALNAAPGEEDAVTSTSPLPAVWVRAVLAAVVGLVMLPLILAAGGDTGNATPAARTTTTGTTTTTTVTSYGPSAGR